MHGQDGGEEGMEGVQDDFVLLFELTAAISQAACVSAAGVRLSPQGELVDADGSAINELGATRFDVATHGAQSVTTCSVAGCVCVTVCCN